MLILTVAVLLAYSLLANPDSLFSHSVRRAFWALTLLLISQETIGVGVNGINFLSVFLLGLPGYGALAALSML